MAVDQVVGAGLEGDALHAFEGDALSGERLGAVAERQDGRQRRRPHHDADGREQGPERIGAERIESGDDGGRHGQGDVRMDGRVPERRFRRLTPNA